MARADRSLPITAVVMTRNEARVIARTVEALGDFSQVLVFDSNSDDDTSLIAEKHGAQVVSFSWDGRYPKKKQWILEHPAVDCDWVFYVDADELPSRELLDELSALSVSGELDDFAAYDVPLSYSFQGKVLHHGHKIYKRSLVRRDKCRFPVIDDLDVSNMWEVEGHYQPAVSGRVSRTQFHMLHHDVDPLFDFFSRHNRYSDWEAHLALNRRARKQVEEVRKARGKAFESLPFKPALFFFYAYIVKRGFLDGMAGFDYAMAYSFYLWQTSAKVRELKRGRRQF